VLKKLKLHATRVAARARSAGRFAKRHRKTLPLLFAMTASVPVASQAQSGRGMWLWNGDSAIQNIGSSRTNLFDFTAAPHGTASVTPFTGPVHAINTIYLYAHKYVNGTATQQAQLRSFLADAHAKGLKVEFLDGATDWATTGKTYGENYLKYALAFNAAGTTAQRFDGIQFDVEPYLNAGWFTQSIWDSFIGLLNDCETLVKSSGQGIPFGVCIPRWYDVTPGPSYLLQVQQITDYVAVMDYVDKVSSLVADAKTEVTNAQQLGKKAVLGVETMVITPTTSTFNEEGYGNMEIALDSLALAYQTNSGSNGTAVHYYDTYAAMTEWGIIGAPADAVMASTTTTVTTTGSIPVTSSTSTTTTTTLKKKKRG
jgi:hypothetical protein